jgi:anti-anti-sigma factor
MTTQTDENDLLKIPSEVTQTVLIVDDDQLVLKALEYTIKQDVKDIIVASSGSKAIDILKSQQIALILCDQRMPEMSGTEVMQQAIDLQPDCIRIIITGNSDEYTAIEAINTGHVNQFIIKPWDDNQLRQAILNGLEQYRLIHQNKELQNLLLQKHKALAESHSNLRRDLQLGAMIHETLLLGNIPSNVPGFAIDATTIPSKEIDGDFFDFYQPAPGVLDVVIGDVMGKGIPAAVVGTAVKTQLVRFATPFSEAKVFNHLSQWEDDILTPWQIISNVHREITPKLIRLEYFVCLFYGRFSLKKKIFSFVDCGSAKPIHYQSKNKKAVELKGQNFPLGVIDKDQFRNTDTHFVEGDFFVFYSDGLTESKSTEGELFGVDRLIQLVEKHTDASASELLLTIKGSVLDFAQQNHFDDDLTLIVIKIDQHILQESSGFYQAIFSSNLSQLKAVREFISKICKKIPGDQELLANQLQLAINEAFCNIYKHTYDGAKNQKIIIQASAGADGLVIELSDQGPSFDPTEIDEPSLAGDKDNGFGWHIIRSIADQVAYVRKQTESGWNHLRIFKHYHYGENTMELSYDQKEDVIIVQLKSESLDAKDAPDFKQKVIDLINTNDARHIIFDLHHLKFIDSSGLGSFLAILRNLNSQNGDLKLANMSNTVRTMFELVSMHKIFEIFNTTDEALRSFAKENSQVSENNERVKQ